MQTCRYCQKHDPLLQGQGCTPYASHVKIAKNAVMWADYEAIKINYCPMCGRKLREDKKDD